MLTHSARAVAGVLSFVAFALFSAQAQASFHLWRIDQVYSDAGGTVQFIEMSTTAGNSSGDGSQQFLAGHAITSSSGTHPVNTFTFPTDLPGDTSPVPPATVRHFLIATQGFAALGVVTPDYVVPNGFLYAPSGTINYAGVDSVPYQALPTDGMHSIDRNSNVMVNSATNFAGQTASVQSVPPAAVNYQGLWWASPAGSESGWGINFAHQGNIIFATWFTYDTTGKALWLSMTATQTATNVYSGTLYQTRGPAFSAMPFNPALVTRTAVGSATLTFTDANDAQFAYTVNGVSQVKPLTREVYAALPNCVFGGTANLAQATNYQDLWWASPAGSESGWGINLTEEGGVIFGTWFTYDTDGTPLWLSVTATASQAGAFTGTLYRTTGPAFDAVPFDPAKVVRTAVGNATFTFSDGANASFVYTVNGVAQTKAITREIFVPPGTLCQ
jgi:hypothetical protein